MAFKPLFWGPILLALMKSHQHPDWVSTKFQVQSYFLLVWSLMGMGWSWKLVSLNPSAFCSMNKKSVIWTNIFIPNLKLQSLVIDLANALKSILSPYSHIICLTLNIMVLKLPIIYWVSEVLVKSYPYPFIPIKVFLEKWENPSTSKSCDWFS
jgi:hypothetical protein